MQPWHARCGATRSPAPARSRSRQRSASAGHASNVLIVDEGDRIVLRPVPDNPIEAIRGILEGQGQIGHRARPKPCDWRETRTTPRASANGASTTATSLDTLRRSSLLRDEPHASGSSRRSVRLRRRFRRDARGGHRRARASCTAGRTGIPVDDRAKRLAAGCRVRCADIPSAAARAGVASGPALSQACERSSRSVIASCSRPLPDAGRSSRRIGVLARSARSEGIDVIVVPGGLERTRPRQDGSPS